MKTLMSRLYLLIMLAGLLSGSLSAGKLTSDDYTEDVIRRVARKFIDQTEPSIQTSLEEVELLIALAGKKDVADKDDAGVESMFQKIGLRYKVLNSDGDVLPE